MPISVGSGESYPGRSFSVSQLLYAAKKKLEGFTIAGRIVKPANQAEVDVLERDILELLGLVRSVKNTFAPINRIPREALSVIPDYWADEDGADVDLIALTHVCHSWREVFISRPSLWTRLDCTNDEKTRTYIERSKSSPLKVYLWRKEGYIPFLGFAFLVLALPHFSRLGSLTLCGPSNELVGLVGRRFNRPAPFLEKLKIRFFGDPHSIEPAIFDRNLPSLQELRLSGIITSLPWGNLANLTTFDFRDVPSDSISTTQLLDFFERAPFLRHCNIRLWNTLATTSNAPPGRVVSLPRLKDLDIKAQPIHSILLNHLLIPSGTSLVQEFGFSGTGSPIPGHLPKTLNNLENLSHITAINLSCKSGLALRLNGPSGGLYVLGHQTGTNTSVTVTNRQILRSLAHFAISEI